MNILELAEFREDHRLPYSKEAIQELVEISSKVLETFDLAVYAFLHWDNPTSKNY